MNILTPLAVRIGAIPWMPKLLPQITATDKFIQRVTKGRVTILDIAGLPNLMLTVKGRKSGVPRTTPLLCVPYESGYLIAGSNFGGAKKPGLGGQRACRRARRASWSGCGSTGRTPAGGASASSPAPSATAPWEHMIETWPNYARYAERTDRIDPGLPPRPGRLTDVLPGLPPPQRWTRSVHEADGPA